MKAGFTIIELMVVLMLSSIIATVLFSSYYAVNRSSITGQNLMARDLRMAIVYRQLYRDLYGCYMPNNATFMVDFKKESNQQPKEEPKKEEGKKQEPKKESKPINDIFVSTVKNRMVETLSFITNNIRPYYPYATNTNVPPYKVRVVYRLVPEGERKDSFILMRQESTELSLAPFTKKNSAIRSYPLADHIKSCKIEYRYPNIEQLRQARSEQEKKEQPPIIEKVTRSEWRFDSKKKDMPPFPQYITVTLELWDLQYAQSWQHTITLEIPLFDAVLDLFLYEPPAQKESETPKNAAQAPVAHGQQPPPKAAPSPAATPSSSPQPLAVAP